MSISKQRKERYTRILLKRQKGICALCYKLLNNDHTLDHIIPKSKGGSNKLFNIQLTHGSCNHAKGSSLQIEVESTKIRITQTTLNGICITCGKYLSSITRFCKKPIPLIHCVDILGRKTLDE